MVEQTSHVESRVVTTERYSCVCSSLLNQKELAMNSLINCLYGHGLGIARLGIGWRLHTITVCISVSKTTQELKLPTK